jgi:AraC-like DNA-binding protein
VTEQGVQQFNCRRARHQSTPGKVFLLEPGDIHDGEAPTEDGFTYRMLYLDPQWLERELSALFEDAPLNSQLSFATTLASDTRLAHAISLAFEALHGAELRIVRQSALDGLLERLTTHLHWRTRYAEDPRLPRVAQKAREYLHAIAPHAYLVQLRLATARRLLARGELPATIAMELGFSDQSHLGRWFVRAYGLTPALYRKRCSNLPDR